MAKKKTTLQKLNAKVRVDGFEQKSLRKFMIASVGTGIGLGVCRWLGGPERGPEMAQVVGWGVAGFGMLTLFMCMVNEEPWSPYAFGAVTTAAISESLYLWYLPV